MENKKLIYLQRSLHKLTTFFTDKKIVDLCCGDGSTMIYIKDKFKCKEICGIDNNINIDEENLKKNNIKLYKSNIHDMTSDNMSKIWKNTIWLNFTGSDTYFLWIENFLIEEQVINILKKFNNKCTIIIVYNSKNNCKKDRIDEENLKNRIYQDLVKYAKIKGQQYSINMLNEYALNQTKNIKLCLNKENQKKKKKKKK